MSSSFAMAHVETSFSRYGHNNFSHPICSSNEVILEYTSPHWKVGSMTLPMESRWAEATVEVSLCDSCWVSQKGNTASAQLFWVAHFWNQATILWGSSKGLQRSPMESYTKRKRDPQHSVLAELPASNQHRFASLACESP